MLRHASQLFHLGREYDHVADLGPKVGNVEQRHLHVTTQNAHERVVVHRAETRCDLGERPAVLTGIPLVVEVSADVDSDAVLHACGIDLSTLCLITFGRRPIEVQHFPEGLPGGRIRNPELRLRCLTTHSGFGHAAILSLLNKQSMHIEQVGRASLGASVACPQMSHPRPKKPK